MVTLRDTVVSDKYLVANRFCDPRQVERHVEGRRISGAFLTGTIACDPDKRNEKGRQFFDHVSDLLIKVAVNKTEMACHIGSCYAQKNTAALKFRTLRPAFYLPSWVALV